MSDLPHSVDRLQSFQTNSNVSALNAPEYSDVVVIVGPSKTKYNLHRVIICTKSPFFKAACKRNTFKEGQERTINLPEINEVAFTTVLNIMYGGKFKLPRNFGIDKTVDIWMTADYLGLDDLLERIIDEMGSWADIYKYENTTKKSYAPVENMVELIRRLLPMCKIAAERQLVELLGRLLLIESNGKIEQFFEMAKNNPNAGLGPEELKILALTALSNKVADRLCGECRFVVACENREDGCHSCGQDMPDEDVDAGGD